MIVSPDKSGRVDGVVHHILKDVKCDIPLVPITRLENFEFNPELLKLDRYILVDFSEYGWNWDMEETHFYHNHVSPRYFSNNTYQWVEFNKFLKDKPPLIIFKRELLKGDFKDNVYPLQYPCWHEIPAVQSREEFNARKINAFFNWGYSHPSRRKLHGNIFLNADKYGYDIVDSFHHFEGALGDGNKNIWATIHTPHFARLPMGDVLSVQALSKISISVSGAGRCCFRHSESPVNAVMALWNDEMRWSHDWVDGKNCIRMDEGKEIETILAALENENLYDIYVAGVENCRNYYLPNYIKYIEQIIEEKI